MVLQHESNLLPSDPPVDWAYWGVQMVTEVKVMVSEMFLHTKFKPWFQEETINQ
jgi:hypothetical protein